MRETHILIGCCIVYQNQTAGQCGSGFHGIRQTAGHIFFNDQPVNHNFNLVFFILFQLDFFRKVIQIAVHAAAYISGFPSIGKDFCVFTLFSANHRSQNLNFGSYRQRLHLINNLVNGLLLDFFAALRAMRYTHMRPKQTKIVIDFRCRSHGGTGVVRCCFLVNGDSRRQALDAVNVRFVHLPQKHSGVRRKAFYIAPLPLCINRIECQTGFSRTGKPRHHNQSISGQVNINIFQIVGSCSANRNRIPHITPLSQYPQWHRGPNSANQKV